MLLDQVAANFIYARPISPQERADTVAFSQPTGDGAALAKSWLGVSPTQPGWKIFGE